jgi:putative copper resistance protein D
VEQAFSGITVADGAGRSRYRGKPGWTKLIQPSFALPYLAVGGHFGSVTVLAMLGLLTLRWGGGVGLASDIGAGVALSVFAITRASMGHAGEEGLLSVALAAKRCTTPRLVWTGAGAGVSAWWALSGGRITRAAASSHERYLDLMSQAATLAVAVICATGVYSAWHRVRAALRIESVVLICAVLAASILISQQPPPRCEALRFRREAITL